MNSPLPLVTIGVPTYNRAARLRACLAHLQAQTYRNFHVIVSDNASTDDTESVAREFAQGDARITYYRQPQNIGATNNLEYLRLQAQGRYFIWVADDDRPAADYIERCVASLEEDPELAVVSGVAEYWNEGALAHAGNHFNCDEEGYLRRIYHYFRVVEDNAIFYGVYRASVLSQCSLQGLNRLGGDWVWMAQILLLGKARMLETTRLARATGGTSSSLRTILRALGRPRWMSIFPRATLVLEVGCGLVCSAVALRSRANLPMRVLLAAMAMGELAGRFLAEDVKRHYYRLKHQVKLALRGLLR